MASNANFNTPTFRAGFISVFKPRPGMNNGPAKYSVRACFPPNTDLTEMKKRAKEAVHAKWGDAAPKQLRNPFRKNEELDNPVAGIGPDWIIVTFSANEDRRPGVVDQKVQDIIDDSEVYSGAWFRANVNAYGYDKAGNKGVAFGLNHVQKLRDDEPIAGGRAPATSAFEAVEEEGAGVSSASDLFQ